MDQKLPKIFEDYLAKRDEKTKACLEQRTAEFQQILAREMSTNGMMKSDIEYLAKIYDLKLPYEEMGE